jgi:hypothetical protein
MAGVAMSSVLFKKETSPGGGTLAAGHCYDALFISTGSALCQASTWIDITGDFWT